MLYTVFPFYWAIVSSLKAGSELFQVEFWPSNPAWENYVACSASSRCRRS